MHIGADSSISTCHCTGVQLLYFISEIKILQLQLRQSPVVNNTS